MRRVAFDIGEHFEQIARIEADLDRIRRISDIKLFGRGAMLGASFADGMFVGQHGSWNRKPFAGYRVIFVPFANGKPNGSAVEVLTGFVEDDDARGRPVGVAIDRRGALLVADDVGNTVWRVTRATP